MQRQPDPLKPTYLEFPVWRSGLRFRLQWRRLLQRHGVQTPALHSGLKDLVWLWLRRRSRLQLRFNRRPGNFHLLQVQPLKTPKLISDKSGCPVRINLPLVYVLGHACLQEYFFFIFFFYYSNEFITSVVTGVFFGQNLKKCLYFSQNAI